jgi:WD40 repeat protein
MKGGRALVTTACYSRDARLIAGACEDGSIKLWNGTGPFISPTLANEAAHSARVTSLQFSEDGNELLSRGMDDTVKLWYEHCM